MCFQNWSNKVAIELRVIQFWSEIILVNSNRTCAVRSFNFEIMRIISDQIVLHSVQLPLTISLLLNQSICTISLLHNFAFMEQLTWQYTEECHLLEFLKIYWTILIWLPRPIIGLGSQINICCNLCSLYS